MENGIEVRDANNGLWMRKIPGADGCRLQVESDFSYIFKDINYVCGLCEEAAAQGNYLNTRRREGHWVGEFPTSILVAELAVASTLNIDRVMQQNATDKEV